MATSNSTVASMILPELLKRGDYWRWSSCMQDYLIAQELWDGIIVPFVFSADHPLLSESEWRKRNAAALYAIKISCGGKSFDRINEIRFAIDAWDKLAKMHENDEFFARTSQKINGQMANMIVPELLERGNYERWSKYMKSYLISQDLWDVTQLKGKPPRIDKKEWKKKDAAALHAILICCDVEKFCQIEECDLAEEAWNELKDIHKEEEKSEKEDDSGKNASEIHNEEEEEKDDSGKNTSKVHEEEADLGQLNDPTNLTSNKNASEIHDEEINDSGKNTSKVLGEEANSGNTTSKIHEEADSDNNASQIHKEEETGDSGIPSDEEKERLKNSITEGDLDTVKKFFDKYKQKAAKAIIDYDRTALHVATICGQLKIVRALLDIITIEDTG